MRIVKYLRSMNLFILIEIEVIGRKQHIIDIVREKCGDDVAEIISEWLDPEDTDDFDSMYEMFEEEHYK